MAKTGKDGAAAANTTDATELFERAPVPRAYFSLALPNLVGKLAMLVYSLADTWFVSSTGNTSLVAGVSLCSPILLVMVALGDCFGQGGASVITRLLGSGDHDRARRSSSFCFWCALICGAVLAALLTIFKAPVLALIGADADTYQYAAQYYSWIVLAAPFVAITSVPLNILRTEGLARQSMMGNIVGSVVNLVLDPILILGLGLGAQGAAIATACSYVSSAAYYVWIYRHRCEWLSIDVRLARLSGSEVKSILVIGIPSCLTNFMQSFGLALTNRFLLPYGSDKVAAYGIALKVGMVVAMVLHGFSFGSLSLVGYNYGSGDRPRLRKILQFAYGFELSLAVVVAAVLAALAPTLMSLFLDDPEVVSAGTQILRAQMAGQLFAGFVIETTCVFQATGRATGALLLSINRQGVLYAVIVAALSATAGYQGVIWAQPVCDFCCAIIGAVILARTLHKVFSPADAA